MQSQQQQQEESHSSSSIPLKYQLLIYLNRWRRFCHDLVRSKFYNYASLIVITFNSILLTQHRFDDPVGGNSQQQQTQTPSSDEDIALVSSSSSSSFNNFLAFLNHICILIFLCELIIKFSAVGLTPFLENPWDVMDLVVIVFSTLAMFFEDISNISSLRVLRWLMPMYSDDGAPAPLRVVTETVFASLQGIVDVMMLSGLFIGLFAVAGVQIWSGMNDNRCYISNITCEEGFLYMNSLNNAQDEKYQYNLYPKVSSSSPSSNMTKYIQKQLPILMTGLASVSGCSPDNDNSCPSDIMHPCLETKCLAIREKYTLPYRNCNSFADCYMVMFNTFLTNDWSIDWEWIVQTVYYSSSSSTPTERTSSQTAHIYVIFLFAYILAYVGNYVGQSLYLCVVANVYSYVAPDFVKSKQQLEDDDISAAQTNNVATKKTSIAWIDGKVLGDAENDNNNNNDENNNHESKVEIDQEKEEEVEQVDCDALIGVPPNITVGDELDIWCKLRVITRQELRDFNKQKQELLLSGQSDSLFSFSKVQAELRADPQDKRHISRCIAGYVVQHPVWKMILLLASFASTVVLLIDNPKSSFIDPQDSFAVIFNVCTIIFVANVVAHVYAFGPRHVFVENREMRKAMILDCGILLRGILILIFPPATAANSSTSNSNDETILEIEASDLIRSIESSLRLSFLARFIFLIPPLRRMFHIAFRSIRSIAYLSALSILVIFVFSIVGYHQFGDLTNFGGPTYPLKFSNSWIESFYISFIVATGDIVIPYMRYLMKELPQHTRWMGVLWVMFIYYSLRGLVVNITACIAVEDVYTATLEEQEQQEEAKRILFEKKNDKNKNQNSNNNAELISNHQTIQVLTNWWQNFMDLVTGHVTEGPPPLILPSAHLPKYGVLQEVEEGLLDIEELEREYQQQQEQEEKEQLANEENSDVDENDDELTESTTTPKRMFRAINRKKPEFIRNGQNLNYLSPLLQLKQVSLTWQQTIEYWYHHPPMFETHRVFIPPKEKSLYIFMPNAEIRTFCLQVVFNPIFRWSCVFFCFVNFFSFLIWPLRIEILNNKDTSSTYSFYFYLEFIMNAFFTLECLTQIIAFGFALPSASKWDFENEVKIEKSRTDEENEKRQKDGIAGYLCANYFNEVETDEGQFDEETPLKLSYCSNLYNVFDFLGAIGAFMTLTSLLHPAFRLLRALRVARLLTLLPESEATFVAFCRALPVAATKILPLGLIVFTFVGVWGVELFQGKLGACNDRSIKHRKDCAGYFDEPNLYAASTTTAGMIFGPAQDPFLLYPATVNKSLLDQSFYSYSSASSSPNNNNVSTSSELFFLASPSSSQGSINSNSNINTTTTTSRLRQRRWQITAYNFENLSEAFMCIFVISGWASTSDILFNTWNAAPRVNEAMGHGSSPLGPLYIMVVYFVACVFIANCMCGFLMYYLLEFRKQYDDAFTSTEWLPEQRMALRQASALRSLLHEKDVRERVPDPKSSLSQSLHQLMRWAPVWFTEKARQLLDPREKDFEKDVQKVEREGEQMEEKADELLHRAESITDFGTAPLPPSSTPPQSPSSSQGGMQQQQRTASNSSYSIASAVRMVSMFKFELLTNNEYLNRKKKKQQQQLQQESSENSSPPKQQSLTWSASELARIEPLSVFDTLVYITITINFICNCLYCPLSTSPEVLYAISKTIQFTLLFFTLELSLRFIAYKHHIFFSDGGLFYHVASREWMFDFFVTFCGWLAPPALNILPYAALFSFLRVLKFKKLIGPRLSVLRLLEATENAHRQILGTCLIIGFGFFLFAVAGVEFFHGTVVPPLMVGWNTEYRHMNSTLPALKLLFDANSGDNWIDFPSDYIAGYRVDMTNVDHEEDYFDEEQKNKKRSEDDEQVCFNSWDNFRGNHKFLDADEGSSLILTTTTTSKSVENATTIAKKQEQEQQQQKQEKKTICRPSKSLVRWYFALSDLILSIIGPAFVGAVMYDALVLGQDEIEDKCRISLLRFHRAWVSSGETEENNKNNNKNNNENNSRGPLPVGEFIKRVLTRLPRELTKFDVGGTNNNRNDKNNLFSPKRRNYHEDENTDEEEKPTTFESATAAATSLLPKPRELLSFLLRTPIPLRENNLVSFDGCLAAIIISGYKLNGRKAERVLGARAFGKLAKMLNGGCKIFTVAHYVAVRIVWYYWAEYRSSRKYQLNKMKGEKEEKRRARRKEMEEQRKKKDMGKDE